MSKQGRPVRSKRAAAEYNKNKQQSELPRLPGINLLSRPFDSGDGAVAALIDLQQPSPPPNAQQPKVHDALLVDTISNSGASSEVGSGADNVLGSGPENDRIEGHLDSSSSSSSSSDEDDPPDSKQQQQQQQRQQSNMAISMSLASPLCSRGVSEIRGAEPGPAGRKRPRRKFRNKAYIEWSCSLLREVCRNRGVKVKVRENDKAMMSRLLSNKDTVLLRPSPFTGDISGDSGADDASDGDKAPSSSIPAGAIQMMRAAMEFGAHFDFEKEPDRAFVFEGSEYRCADVKSVIDGRRDPTARKKLDVNSRKTPHCLARLVHLIADDKFHDAFLRSRLPASSRQELDAKRSGANGDIWQDLLAAFVDTNYKVQSKLGDDPRVSHIDPNVVGQPNMTAERLKQMYIFTKKNYNEALGNFNQPGHHSPFWNFCRRSTDVYVFRKVVEREKHMEDFVDALQPEEARMDCPGTRGTDGTFEAKGSAAEDARRRALGKRKARETYAGRKALASKNKTDGSLTADVFMKQCLDSIGSMLAPSPVAGEGEPPSAVDELSQLEIDDKRVKTYKLHKEDLAEEKAKGEEADTVLVEYLEHRINLLIAKLKER